MVKAQERAICRPATKREQREASVENILAAALALFVSQGYRHATVEQIAASAALTKGAVYFYFRNKSALLLALLDRAEKIVVDDMLDRVAAADKDPESRMVAFIHGQARLGVERAELVLLLVLMSLEFRGVGDAVETRVTKIYGRLYDTVESILREGRRSGVFRTDTGVAEQAAIVMAGHDGTFLEWYRRQRDLDGAALVRALRISMLGGLKHESVTYEGARK